METAMLVLVAPFALFVLYALVRVLALAWFKSQKQVMAEEDKDNG